jgi:flagellin-like protein
VNSNPSFYFHRNDRRRYGVSPVIASVIILGITVTLGLALWTFVNSEVNTSTEVFANEVTDYVNYLNDRFIIVNMAFQYHHQDVDDACTFDDDLCVTVWIYNNGNLPVKINSILFGNSSSVMQQPETWASSEGERVLTIQKKQMGILCLDVTGLKDSAGEDLVLTADQTYYLRVVSESGANNTFFQKMGD